MIGAFVFVSQSMRLPVCRQICQSVSQSIDVFSSLGFVHLFFSRPASNEHVALSIPINSFCMNLSYIVTKSALRTGILLARVVSLSFSFSARLAIHLIYS